LKDNKFNSLDTYKIKIDILKKKFTLWNIFSKKDFNWKFDSKFERLESFKRINKNESQKLLLYFIIISEMSKFLYLNFEL
jgi:hypothetical protein